jgi:Flp pilus assembly protein TadD
LRDYSTASAPRSARALDKLGAAYIALGRPADAEKVLRRAFVIAPEDPEVLMHLGRALMDLGQEEQAREVLAKVSDVVEIKQNGLILFGRGPQRS